MTSDSKPGACSKEALHHPDCDTLEIGPDLGPSTKPCNCPLSRTNEARSRHPNLDDCDAGTCQTCILYGTPESPRTDSPLRVPMHVEADNAQAAAHFATEHGLSDQAIEPLALMLNEVFAAGLAHPQRTEPAEVDADNCGAPILVGCMRDPNHDGDHYADHSWPKMSKGGTTMRTAGESPDLGEVRRHCVPGNRPEKEPSEAWKDVSTESHGGSNPETVLMGALADGACKSLPVPCRERVLPEAVRKYRVHVDINHATHVWTVEQALRIVGKVHDELRRVIDELEARTSPSSGGGQ